MIRGLRRIGCIVDEAHPRSNEDLSGSESGGWVAWIKRYLPKPLYELAEVGYSLVAYRTLSSKIRANRPDGIYERYNLYLLAGVWAKRRFGLPLVLEVNSPMVLERRQYGGLYWPWIAKWAERYVWRNADALLPVTHVLAAHLISEGVEPKRISVIPNGINEDHYAGLPSVEAAKQRFGLSGKFVIGFIGFVREWDRLDRIVRWVARHAAIRPAHLLIIGDGPAREEIQRCALELGVVDRMTITGVVDRAQVPAAAMAFDIALQTALVPYASPLCLFEYLALSKAIIAPDQPNHHEILINRENSLLYDPDDEGGIEAALDELCADASLRDQIARGAGLVIARKGLTWKHHACKVADVMSGLTGAPSPRLSTAQS